MARVILADDDPFLIKIYKTRLTQDGHEVVTCSDGETALEESLKQKPDLVVLDIMLPRLNGLEVLSGIRADKKCKDVPVVFLTNLAQEEEQKEEVKRKRKVRERERKREKGERE